MSCRALRRRLAAAEAQVGPRPAPAPPALEWYDPLCRERVDLWPLAERMSERAAEHMLYGTPTCYWTSDLPEMWPLLGKFRDWISERFPGRLNELEVPFPEQLADGSWRSRVAPRPGRGPNRGGSGRRGRAGGAEARPGPEGL